ncbi:uncharacterized protein [Amphiura filiformis]|uniref:uncharacterized protein n=1 Tax=Amphiura filiformis TaxID=82378 RepID=UPI003B20F9F1
MEQIVSHMMRQLASVALFVVVYITPGSLGERCYVGQDGETVWKADWDPCNAHCDKIALGGFNTHPISSASDDKQTVGVYLTELASGDAKILNFNCSGDVKPPRITCPEDQTTPTATSKNVATVTWSSPQADDNSGFHPTVRCDHTSGSSFTLGTTTVKCVATDLSQNSKQCQFSVNIIDMEAPTITCPENQHVSTDAGTNSASVIWASLTVRDNSGLGSNVACDHTSGSTFKMGTTIVEYVATDAARNSNSCQFSVNVADMEAPTITCPENQDVSTAAGTNSALVIWASLSVQDNSGLGPNVACDHTSGSTFTMGTTIVECIATDAARNSNRCQFKVNVLDMEAPTITCPENQDVSTAAGTNSALVIWASLSVQDNSGLGPNVACDHTSGSTFTMGTTIVECIATDAARNSNRCQFKVNVLDMEAPTITCPENQHVSTAAGTNSASVIWASLTVRDNSGLGSNVACDHTSGSTFKLGTTIVECVATDAAQNSNSCQFSVNVADEEPPTFACPINIHRHSSDVDTNVVATWSELQVTDNSNLPTSHQCNPPSGSAFIPGITKVTCNATDSALNSRGCQFEVQVQVDCQSIFDGGSTTSGVYRIYPDRLNRIIRVYCDMETEGGPWTVFQKRFDGSVNFYRSWDEYGNGFGDLNGEFWLGNTRIHRMTLHGTWELRVDLGDYSNPAVTRYALYDNFAIGSQNEKFRLSIGTYNGSAGDSLSWHNGQDFYTYDQDSPDLCAQDCHGGWWYTSCRHSNLNGPWGGPSASGVSVPAFGNITSHANICEELMVWVHFKGDWEAVKTTEMKMRRKQLE